MLRLLYLLIRQRLHGTRSGAGADAAWRGRRPMLVAGVGALALAVGVAAYALLGGPHTSATPPDAALPRNATLQLQVARVESAPLVVYLEALGAADANVAERVPPTVKLTSVHGLFEPAFQVAPVAARVEVDNADPIAHNTHVFDGRRTLFNVALPLQGMPVTKALTRSGLFEVRCDLHPWMRAALFVPPSAHHAVIREPGEFVLRDIPPGSYRLHAWTADRGRTTQVVDLPPGATRALELAAH